MGGGFAKSPPPHKYRLPSFRKRCICLAISDCIVESIAALASHASPLAEPFGPLLVPRQHHPESRGALASTAPSPALTPRAAEVGRWKQCHSLASGLLWLSRAVWGSRSFRSPPSPSSGAPVPSLNEASQPCGVRMWPRASSWGSICLFPTHTAAITRPRTVSSARCFPGSCNALPARLWRELRPLLRWPRCSIHAHGRGRLGAVRRPVMNPSLPRTFPTLTPRNPVTPATARPSRQGAQGGPLDQPRDCSSAAYQR